MTVDFEEMTESCLSVFLNIEIAPDVSHKCGSAPQLSDYLQQ